MLDRGSDVIGEGAGSTLGRDRGKVTRPGTGRLGDWGGSGSGGESIAVAVAAHPQDCLSLAPRTRGHKARFVPEDAGSTRPPFAFRCAYGGYDFLGASRMNCGTSADL
jgi:hypothetical protein